MDRRYSTYPDEPVMPHPVENVLAAEYAGELMDTLTLAGLLGISLRTEDGSILTESGEQNTRLSSESWGELFEALSELAQNPQGLETDPETRIQVLASANHILRLSRYGLED